MKRHELDACIDNIPQYRALFMVEKVPAWADGIFKKGDYGVVYADDPTTICIGTFRYEFGAFVRFVEYEKC